MVHIRAASCWACATGLISFGSGVPKGTSESWSWLPKRLPRLRLRPCAMVKKDSTRQMNQSRMTMHDMSVQASGVTVTVIWIDAKTRLRGASSLIPRPTSNVKTEAATFAEGLVMHLAYRSRYWFHPSHVVIWFVIYSNSQLLQIASTAKLASILTRLQHP